MGLKTSLTSLSISWYFNIKTDTSETTIRFGFCDFLINKTKIIRLKLTFFFTSGCTSIANTLLVCTNKHVWLPDCFYASKPKVFGNMLIILMGRMYNTHDILVNFIPLIYNPLIHIFNLNQFGMLSNHHPLPTLIPGYYLI